MEIPPQDLYEIYERLDAEAAANPTPVTLDNIWEAISASSYLRSLGCCIVADGSALAIELNHIPGIPDGTVLTASRDTFERGLPEVSCVRFASYGEPAFDAILELTAVGGLPPGIQRVAVPIPGADGAQLVGYMVMRQDKNGVVAPLTVFDMSELKNPEIDEHVPVPLSAVESLTAQLAARAGDEFRILAAAPRIEEANQKAGRAQFLLSISSPDISYCRFRAPIAAKPISRASSSFSTRSSKPDPS
jgi:hypothetical protein